MGQICVNQECQSPLEVVKQIISPSMIAIFAVSAIVLVAGIGLLLCFCFKCCCFRNRKRPVKSTIHTPQHQHQQPLSYQVNQDDIQGPSPYQVNQNDIQGPAPLPFDHRPNQKLGSQMFHTEEKIQVVPIMSPNYDYNNVDSIVPSRVEYYHQDQPHVQEYYEKGPPPPPKDTVDSTSALSDNYISKTYYDTTLNRNNAFSQHNPSRLSRPVSTGTELMPPQQKKSRASLSKDVLPSSGGVLMHLHQPVMNEKMGPIVNQDAKPPLDVGFFGFWDKEGHFHQGYTDEMMVIHGGVFDDLTYFHFDSVGKHDPIFVQDDMMAGSISGKRNGKGSQESSGNRLSIPDDGTRERGASLDVLSTPDDGKRERGASLDVLSIPDDGTRERGASLDVMRPDSIHNES